MTASSGENRALLERHWAAGKVGVPAIAFWEVGILQFRSRIELPSPVRDSRDGILAAGVIELPLDGNVALRALELSGVHNDPADRFILATTLVHGAALLTADVRLLDWRHALKRHDART